MSTLSLSSPLTPPDTSKLSSSQFSVSPPSRWPSMTSSSAPMTPASAWLSVLERERRSARRTRRASSSSRSRSESPASDGGYYQNTRIMPVRALPLAALL